MREGEIGPVATQMCVAQDVWLKRTISLRPRRLPISGGRECGRKNLSFRTAKAFLQAKEKRVKKKLFIP